MSGIKQPGVSFPPLGGKERRREFDLYSDSQKAEVVRQFLFGGKTHRQLDHEVLELDSKKSHGYQSMGILHFIGLMGAHRGLFNGLSSSEAEAILDSVTAGRIELLRRLALKKDGILEWDLRAKAVRAEKAGDFDATNIVDAREKCLAAIVSRRGQPKFRRTLLAAYGGRCAITGCNAEAALEAAHIIGYKGKMTHHPQNGLLLRADIHTVFDCHLISVDSGRMEVVVSPRLGGTTYEELEGKSLKLPVEKPFWPSLDALRRHRSECGF